MHGMTLDKEHESTLLLEDGWYGDDITGIKAIFPTTSLRESEEYEDFTNYWFIDGVDLQSEGIIEADSDCELWWFEQCTYEFGDGYWDEIYMHGTIIKEIIE